MLTPLHIALRTNHSLKIIACIIGFTLWSLMSDLHYITKTFVVPVHFYNSENSIIQEAPENVTVRLQGKKSDFRYLNFTTLAAHIDAKTLLQQTNLIHLTAEQLFLPQTIKLVSYKPLCLTIKIAQEN